MHFEMLEGTLYRPTLKLGEIVYSPFARVHSTLASHNLFWFERESEPESEPPKHR